jgi:hypothetical protein
MTRFPRLHSFGVDKLASVKNYLDLDDPIDSFHLPLPAQAFEGFHEFNYLINQTRSTQNSDGNYLCLANKIYKLTF